MAKRKKKQQAESIVEADVTAVNEETVDEAIANEETASEVVTTNEEPVIDEQIHEDSVLEETDKKKKAKKEPKAKKAPKAEKEPKGKKTKKKAVARKDMTKAQWTWHEIKRNKIAYVMIAPFMFIFTLFTVFPVGLSLVLSFTNFNMINFSWDIFTGVDNYIRLFLKDEIFLLACKNTLVFAAVTGPVSYVLSFLVAWFINELSPRLRAIVTLIFYAPSISGNVYLIWGTLFHNDSQGWVNGILMKMNIIDAPILWFYDEKYAMTLCIVVALWMSLGTAFLSFIAGLQTVDKSLFEAAAVDGIKNRWQELWYITLPMMRPQLMFGAVMSITGAFGFGGVVTALCGFPSVNYSCHTIMHCLEDYGSTRWEVGYASAIAFVLFLIMIGANTLVNKMLSKVGQ